MLTFRRSVSSNLMNMWWELVGLVEGTSLSEEDDQLLWSYTTSGKYLVQTLYAVINHRGMTHRFVSAIWKIEIPPRV